MGGDPVISRLLPENAAVSARHAVQDRDLSLLRTQNEAGLVKLVVRCKGEEIINHWIKSSCSERYFSSFPDKPSLRICYYKWTQSYWLNVGIRMFSYWTGLSKKPLWVVITSASGCKISVTLLITYSTLDGRVICSLQRLLLLKKKKICALLRSKLQTCLTSFGQETCIWCTVVTRSIFKVWCWSCLWGHWDHPWGRFRTWPLDIWESSARTCAEIIWSVNLYLVTSQPPPSHPFSSDFKLCHVSPHFPFDFTARGAAWGKLAGGDVCRVRIKGKELAPEKNVMATTAPAEAFIRRD